MAHVELPQDDARVGASAAAPTRSRLLVVDDNVMLADWIATVGRRLGFEVVIADRLDRCPDPAIYRPQMVLLDLNLGIADGISVEDALPTRYGAPIVLMSGEADATLEAAEAACRARGWPIVASLSKPFSLPALRELLLRYRDEPPRATAAGVR